MNETFSYEGAESWVEPWKVWKYYLTPIIITIGIVGNTCSFVVFVFSCLRKLSISVYLSGLAVSDTGFLITIGVVWLDSTFKVPLFDTDTKCQLLIFCTYVFSFLSVWFVVAFTAEIYFSIFYPLLSDKLCRKKVALTTTYILVVLAISAYSAVFWAVKTFAYQGHQNCHFKDIGSIRGLSIADTIITLLLPFSLIIFMNIRIFIDMAKFYGRGTCISRTIRHPSLENESTLTTKISISSRSVSADGFPTPSFNLQGMQSDNTHSDVTVIGNIEPQYDNSSFDQADRIYKKTIKMLLVVAVVFLLFNLPSHIIRIQHTLRSLYQSGYKPTRSESYWLDVFNTIHWVNYAINFALYSACAKSFRQVVARGLWSFITKMYIICSRITCERRMAPYHSPTPLRMVAVPGFDKVECHLSAIRFSQLVSMDADLVLDSPPCLLANNPDVKICSGKSSESSSRYDEGI